MATPTEFFRWWIVDERTGKRRLRSFAMDRETAQHRYPRGTPDERTRELRTVYEVDEAPPNAKPPL